MRPGPRRCAAAERHDQPPPGGTGHDLGRTGGSAYDRLHSLPPHAEDDEVCRTEYEAFTHQPYTRSQAPLDPIPVPLAPGGWRKIQGPRSGDGSSCLGQVLDSLSARCVLVVGRPRETLGFRTPAEKLAELIEGFDQAGVER